MKRLSLATAVAATFIVPCAHAQSSVTLYGLLDSGITMLSNAGGSRVWKVDSGIQQASRFGFLGTEDLGGGMKAVFRLENGFSIINGSAAQGGLLFGRQAYVGLSNQYGTVTLGRQYDFMAQELGMIAAATYAGGGYAWHLGDQDRIAGERFNNAVKYLSPNISGLTFGAMYSFGGVPGNFKEDSAWSAGLNYLYGPLSIGAAYSTAHDTQLPVYSYLGLSRFDGQNVKPSTVVSLDRITNFGVGANYTIGSATLHALYTWTQFASPSGSVALKIYEGGANYWITPALTVGAAYTYSSMSPNHWGQVSAGVDYFLSKRTDVYLDLNTIRASGPNVAAVLPLQSPSSNKMQTAVGIGMRTKF
ncbi:porin [Burkholderia cepacia]|uniref:porin n=1 Tax=Burkholderia cepacia TaxID=292 RepID=UPI001575125C|nr:porin [Burkholderia cepacia]NTX21302.1 porin [Burkholderia cepacia]